MLVEKHGSGNARHPLKTTVEYLAAHREPAGSLTWTPMNMMIPMSKTPRMPHIYRNPRQGRMATLVAAIADPAPYVLAIINAWKRMPYF